MEIQYHVFLNSISGEEFFRDRTKDCVSTYITAPDLAIL